MAGKKIDPGLCDACSQPNNLPPEDAGQPWRCDRHVGPTHAEQQLAAYDQQCQAEELAAQTAADAKAAKAAAAKARAEAAAEPKAA